MRTNHATGGSLAGLKIGFFGKGGAGKSTGVVLVGRVLARVGYVVCIVDADSTNVGLHRALGADHAPDPLIEYFGGMVFGGGAVTCPVDDPTRLPEAEISLDALPRELYMSVEPNLHLLVAGKLGAWGVGAGCDGPISKIVRDIRIRSNSDPLVTLIDFKAGFEDMARGVVTGIDWGVVVVDPTQASLDLASNMQKIVVDLRAGKQPATEHLESTDLVMLANELFRTSRLRGVSVVLSRVGSDAMESFLRKGLARHGIEPIGVVHDDPAIGLAWLEGAPVRSPNNERAVNAIVMELEKAVEGHLVK